VSVAGFDDVPESEFFNPPLTTVRQDFGEVGRRSIEILLRKIEGERVPARGLSAEGPAGGVARRVPPRRRTSVGGGDGDA